jgi:hypothetical protein
VRVKELEGLPVTLFLRCGDARWNLVELFQQQHIAGCPIDVRENTASRSRVPLYVAAVTLFVLLIVATRDASDNLTMYGMHNGLKPVLCSKLVVDMVEMVTKCLRADPKFPYDFGRILTV